MAKQKRGEKSFYPPQFPKIWEACNEVCDDKIRKKLINRNRRVGKMITRSKYEIDKEKLAQKKYDQNAT